MSISTKLGPKSWTQLVGSTSDQVATSVATGSDGSIYMAGWTQSGLDGQAYKGGASDAFLTKYNPDGTKAWLSILGTNFEDKANAITTGADGSIFVTGYTYGNLEGQSNPSGRAAFLTKYDANGTKIWTRLLGVGLEDTANALATGKDGMVYVAGYAPAQTDALGNILPRGVFLTKYSPDGSKVWTRLPGSNLIDDASALTIGADGAIYLAGTDNYSLTATYNENGAVVTKYSPDGTNAWTSLESPIGSLYHGYRVAGALTIGQDGSIYVAGRVNDDLIDNGFNTDAYITKYKPNGSIEWSIRLASRYQNSFSVSAAGLTTGIDGAIYVAGGTAGSFDERYYAGNRYVNGSNDAFVTKIKPDGTKEWTVLSGSSYGDNAVAISTGTDG